MHPGIILIIALVVLIAAAVSYFSLHSTAPNVTSSIAQKYCYFNGTTYYSSNRIISGNFTVVAHVNFLSPGVLISQGIGNNSHAEWYLGIGGETGGKLGFGVFSNASTGSGTTFGWRFATANVMYNKWYYVAGVYNTTNVSLYVNGSMVASTPTPYAPINGSHVIFIGRRTSAFYVLPMHVLPKVGDNPPVPTRPVLMKVAANINVSTMAITPTINHSSKRVPSAFSLLIESWFDKAIIITTMDHMPNITLSIAPKRYAAPIDGVTALNLPRKPLLAVSGPTSQYINTEGIIAYVKALTGFA